MVKDIVPVSKLQQYLLFWALVFFHFFDVPMEVKDIVNRLHPWKAMQPYAALKIEGSRCFLLGYPNSHVFRMEDLPLVLHKAPLLAAYRVGNLSFKAYFVSQAQAQKSFLVRGQKV